MNQKIRTSDMFIFSPLSRERKIILADSVLFVPLPRGGYSAAAPPKLLWGAQTPSIIKHIITCRIFNQRYMFIYDAGYSNKNAK